MPEGTKDLSIDAQRAAQVKPNHKIMAIDPDTGMFVFFEPDQLGGTGGGGGDGGSGESATFTDESFDI